MALKSELQIRKKAMQNDGFPSQEIIDEFMQEPIDMGPLQLDWCQPNLVKFVVSEAIIFRIAHRTIWMIYLRGFFVFFSENDGQINTMG